MGCDWEVVGTVAVRKGLLRRPRFLGVPHRLAGITSDCGGVPQRLVGEVYKQAAFALLPCLRAMDEISSSPRTKISRPHCHLDGDLRELDHALAERPKVER